MSEAESVNGIPFSVVYRGKAFARITLEDYNEAIAELKEARTQLEPDGDNCHVCHDSGHQAWECRHNPLVMARRAAQMEGEWRCFHCGAVFTDSEAAREHFGSNEDVFAQCIDAMRKAANELLRVLDLSDPPDYGYIYDANEAECCGCQHKAPTIELINHDPDCLNLVVTVLRTAVALTDATTPDSVRSDVEPLDVPGGIK